MSKSVAQLLSELTLEEKAGLCSGQDFWTTKAVDRLGIPSWMMTDGPHGLRKQKANGSGFMDAVPATCFPSGAGLASTWNRDLLEEVGRALGRESKAEQVGVILGPGANLKRSPLCGRNFEYFSEDPYLAGQMAKHHILGVQSQGVGASLKHFAVNNQEKLRMTIDAVVAERTIRELYLPAYETAVKEAAPWTVMTSYNKINGTYAAENAWLQTQVLKGEWGFEGATVTDWGGNNDRVAAIRAGQDLEMPGNGGLTDAAIVRAVRDGSLAMADLDKAVRRILVLTQKVQAGLDPSARFDVAVHHALASKVASESMVLLKNDGGLLPLKARKTVALLGAFAQTPRYQGGGSSHMVPTRLDDAVAESKSVAPGTEIRYGAGYSLTSDAPEAGLLAEAKALAQAADVAVVFIGMTDSFESEGFDRTHLGIPASHTALLEEVLKVQKNVVVVLSNGSPIEMPWVNRVPAVLEGYLGGQAWGGAVADVLFGKTNPSGKLAETFPVRLEDNPSYLNFPGDGKKVEYREGLFVGYRHYDALHLQPLFPFGHGLSYTTFTYGTLALDKASIKETENVTVKVTVTNSGAVAGAEVVQLYVTDDNASVLRPVRELKGFAKVFLNPGESKTVSIVLGSRAFAFWSEAAGDWRVESGSFTLSVGSSSRDLRQTASVQVNSRQKVPRVWDQNTPLVDLKDHPVGKAFYQPAVSQFLSLFGAVSPDDPAALFMESMISEMPLRNLVRMGGGKLSEAQLEELLKTLNQAG
jgi:beta-glucosidase